jgi:glycosyltransferase involved in cell wall biosynthesis
MRILILTKRQYMAKDLLDDRYGRYRELPLELARLGHHVEGLALSYRRRAEATMIDAPGAAGAQVRWHSVNLRRGLFPAIGRYLDRARRLIGEFQPDVIWAGSDAYHVIFAARLAHDGKIKCVIDLYDNFESFGATKLPAVLPLFRRSIRSAGGVTCVSAQLATHIRDAYRYDGPQLVLKNAVRTDLFRPLERSTCRAQLSLPATAKLIGTAGALHKNRGIETLYRAFERLAASDHSVRLVVAGPRRMTDRLPSGERTHDLGNLPLETVPLLINALDVAVICNRNSAFGRFNFPQKAYEIIACGVPMVAAAVGSMNELFKHYPDCLFDPEDCASLADAIRRQLDHPLVTRLSAPSWADTAVGLSDFLSAIVTSEKTGSTMRTTD